MRTKFNSFGCNIEGALFLLVTLNRWRNRENTQILRSLYKKSKFRVSGILGPAFVYTEQNLQNSTCVKYIANPNPSRASLSSARRREIN